MNRVIKTTIIIFFLIIAGVLMTTGLETDTNGWTTTEAGEKFATNPYYFTKDYNCTIAMIYNRIYLDCPDGVRITDDNHTKWGDLYAGELYAQALHVNNFTVNNTLDYNVTGDANITGNLTTNNIIITGNKGLVFDQLQEVWAFKIMNGLGIDNTGMYFNTSSGQVIIKYLGYDGWATDINGNEWHGLALVDYDPRIFFNGVTNQGVYKWDQSEDYFVFEDELMIQSGEKLLLAAATTYLEDSGNAMRLSAPNGIIIGNGQATVDYHIRIDGESNDGDIYYREDEDIIEIRDTTNFTEDIIHNSSIVSDWWFEPQYISTTTTKTSNLTTNEFNPFHDIWTIAFGAKNNTQNGINYDQNSGNFTITEDGTYIINAGLTIEGSATNTIATIRIKNEGTTIWDTKYTIHSSVDPLYRGGQIITHATAGENIELTISCTANCRTYNGTTINIHKIA